MDPKMKKVLRESVKKDMLLTKSSKLKISESKVRALIRERFEKDLIIQEAVRLFCEELNLDPLSPVASTVGSRDEQVRNKKLRPLGNEQGLATVSGKLYKAYLYKIGNLYSVRLVDMEDPKRVEWADLRKLSQDDEEEAVKDLLQKPTIGDPDDRAR
jgi:hypothetical protein